LALESAQGLIRRTALSEVGSRGKLVFLQFDGAVIGAGTY
jgi:hypothetical protein